MKNVDPLVHTVNFTAYTVALLFVVLSKLKKGMLRGANEVLSVR
jgi:hypothetical protein